jgi:hypothetical protein
MVENTLPHGCYENTLGGLGFRIRIKVSQLKIFLCSSFSLCGKTTQRKPCSGPVLALYRIAVLFF